MVVIRLARGGQKQKPVYRMVVADSRMPRNGRYIEQVGYHNPRIKDNNTKIDLARVDHWLSEGAKMSERAAHIVKNYRSAQAPVEA